jgi:hypothetical protein
MLRKLVERKDSNMSVCHQKPGILTMKGGDMAPDMEKY